MDKAPLFPLLHPPGEQSPAYDRYGPEVPHSPVVISVPHAARDYPAGLLALSRFGQAGLERLEDRHADQLAYGLIAQGHTVFVARQPRALIDLNRHEREYDPGQISALPPGHPVLVSAKVRGGLGLVPARLAGFGDLWRGPLPWTELERRVADYHRPYHAALADMMRRTRDAHGHAILIDVHSMPPIAPANGALPPRVVLGDLYGRSAASRLTALAAAICAGRGLKVAQNHPYPGHYLLERHGRPARGLHALQCELDRSLYLDPALRNPGPGLAAMQRLLCAMALALGQELPRSDFAQAAE